MNALVTNPLVSIVIPVYNIELYIEDAIRSAISQTYQNIEIIIVDNCSTDLTWSILNTWASKDHRIKIYQNKTNIGPVLNWNECFKHASGEYIKILWSDDWMALDFIERAVNLIDEKSAFVISNHKIVSENGKVDNVKYKKQKYTRKEYLYNILFQNIEKFPLSPGCALFRTKDLNDNFVIDIPNTDGLDSKKNGAGNDLLIFLNIVLNYAHISILQYDGSFFRAHKESFSIQNQLELYYEWAKVYFIQKKLNKTYYSNIKKIMFWQQINKGNKIYHNLYVCLKYNYWMPLSFCIIMLGGVLNSLRNRK